MSNPALMPGRYPGEVKMVLQDTRQCRVAIPGLTDGSEVWLLAEIEYPVGSRSRGEYPTEIEILPGDLVWLSFIGGDPRYPVITGYRNANTGNSGDWRRWHHANIEILADDTLRLTTTDGNHQVTLSESGVTIITSGDAMIQAGGDVMIQAGGQVAVDGATVVVNGGSAGGVVCQEHLCAFTGAPHIQASTTVTAGT
jgi:hypothetical protein